MASAGCWRVFGGRKYHVGRRRVEKYVSEKNKRQKEAGDTRAYAVLKNLQNIEDIKDYRKIIKDYQSIWWKPGNLKSKETNGRPMSSHVPNWSQGAAPQHRSSLPKRQEGWLTQPGLPWLPWLPCVKVASKHGNLVSFIFIWFHLCILCIFLKKTEIIFIAAVHCISAPFFCGTSFPMKFCRFSQQ